MSICQNALTHRRSLSRGVQRCPKTRNDCHSASTKRLSEQLTLKDKYIDNGKAVIIQEFSLLKANSFAKKSTLLDSPQLMIKISEMVGTIEKKARPTPQATKRPATALNLVQRRPTHELSYRKRADQLAMWLNDQLSLLDSTKDLQLTDILQYKQHLYSGFMQTLITDISKQCRQRAQCLRQGWTLMCKLMQRTLALLINHNNKIEKQSIVQQRDLHHYYQQSLKVKQQQNQHLQMRLKEKEEFIGNLVYDLRFKRRQIARLYASVRIFTDRVNEFKRDYLDLQNEHIQLQMFSKDITKETAEMLMERRRLINQQKNQRLRFVQSKKKNRRDIVKKLEEESKAEVQKLKQNLEINYKIQKGEKGPKFLICGDLDEFGPRLAEQMLQEQPFVIEYHEYGFIDQAVSAMQIPLKKVNDQCCETNHWDLVKLGKVKCNETQTERKIFREQECQWIRPPFSIVRNVDEWVRINQCVAVSEKPSMVMREEPKKKTYKSLEKTSQVKTEVREKQKKDKKIKAQAIIERMSSSRKPTLEFSQKSPIKARTKAPANKLRQSQFQEIIQLQAQLGQLGTQSQISKFAQNIRKKSSKNIRPQSNYVNSKKQKALVDKQTIDLIERQNKQFASPFQTSQSNIDKQDIQKENAIRSPSTSTRQVTMDPATKLKLSFTFRNTNKLLRKSLNPTSKNTLRKQFISSTFVQLRNLSPSNGKPGSISACTVQKCLIVIRDFNKDQLAKILQPLKTDNTRKIMQEIIQAASKYKNGANIDKIFSQTLFRLISDVYILAESRQQPIDIWDTLYNTITLGYGNIKNNNIVQKMVHMMAGIYRFRDKFQSFQLFCMICGLSTDRQMNPDSLCFALATKLYLSLNCSSSPTLSVDNVFTTYEMIHNNCPQILKKFIGHSSCDKIMAKLQRLVMDVHEGDRICLNKAILFIVKQIMQMKNNYYVEYQSLVRYLDQDLMFIELFQFILRCLQLKKTTLIEMAKRFSDRCEVYAQDSKCMSLDTFSNFAILHDFPSVRKIREAVSEMLEPRWEYMQDFEQLSGQNGSAEKELAKMQQELEITMQCGVAQKKILKIILKNFKESTNIELTSALYEMLTLLVIETQAQCFTMFLTGQPLEGIFSTSIKCCIQS